MDHSFNSDSTQMLFTLELSAQAGLWFFITTLPICFWVMLSDLRAMRIPNKAVLALVAVYLVVGLWVLPLPLLAWQLVHLVVMLVIGFVLNAGGVFGAGDAKFVAAAAPFVMLGDASFVTLLLAVNLLAAYLTHRFAGRTALRRLAPDWESWTRKKDFPMGLSLGSTLSIYLGLAAFFGS